MSYYALATLVVLVCGTLFNMYFWYRPRPPPAPEREIRALDRLRESINSHRDSVQALDNNITGLREQIRATPRFRLQGYLDVGNTPSGAGP